MASDGVKISASSSQYNALTQRKETQGLVSYCEPALRPLIISMSAREHFTITTELTNPSKKGKTQGKKYVKYSDDGVVNIRVVILTIATTYMYMYI